MTAPSTHTAYLGLGSNLGDRASYINQAKQALTGLGQLVAESSLYETAPQGWVNQPAFLNCAVALATDLSPRDLLAAALTIENQLGRVRTMLLGPRIIDIDILLYDDLVVSEKNLTIPHPSLHKRAFALIPLLEIDPDISHPVLQRKMSELLRSLPDQSVTKLTSH